MTSETAVFTTPDTTAYMVAAYGAIGTVLTIYALSLLRRIKNAKETP